MNAMESNLLVQADRMGESSLVDLRDWELAYLRVAMLRQVEETLVQSLAGSGAGDGERERVCVDRSIEKAGITGGQR